MYNFLNIVGSKAIKLQEEIKRLNEEFGFDIALTGDEKYKDLQAMVKDAQTKAKAILKEKDGSDNQDGAAEKSGKKDAVYVWIKSPAYVDKDGTKRLAGGFYHISLAEFPRLKNLPKTVCEIFDETPVRRLAEIGKWFGINVDKHDDDELLDMLLKEPALY